MSKYLYGLKPSQPDHRNHRLGFTGDPANLPTSYGPVSPTNFIFNQTNNDCTANGMAMAIKKWCLLNNYKWPYMPSRRQIYYQTGLLEGTPVQDNGRTVADTFKAINTFGVCPEDENSSWNWPYSDAVDVPPANYDEAMKDAALHKCLTYGTINQDQASIQQALVNGYLVLIGITCYQSIESQQTAETGIISMPGWFEQVVGGHLLCLNEYDPQYWSGPNSWGSGWGDKGRYHLPIKYLLDPNLTSDIWFLGLTQ